MLPRTQSIYRRALTGVLVASIALSACGGDDDGAADSPGGGSAAEATDGVPDTADAEATGATPASDGSTPAAPTEASATSSGEVADREQWIAVGADSLGGSDREMDECLAAGVVDGMGYENLAASGATPEQFWSATEITEFGIAVDDADGVVENLVGCGELVDYFAEVSGGTEALAACMREFLDNEDIASVIVTSMLGAEPSDELLAKQTDVRTCSEEAGDE